MEFAIGCVIGLVVTCVLMFMSNRRKSEDEELKCFQDMWDTQEVNEKQEDVKKDEALGPALTGRLRRRKWKVGMDQSLFFTALWIFDDCEDWDDYESPIYYEYEDGTWVNETTGEVYDSETEISEVVNTEEVEYKSELVDEDVETVEFEETEQFATTDQIEMVEAPSFDLTSSYDSGSSFDSGSDFGD